MFHGYRNSVWNDEKVPKVDGLLDSVNECTM